MNQDTDFTAACAAAADLIAEADALIISAGAGMGVDSGLPDFRGNTGFWQAYPALAQARLDFTQVASPQTFAHDPALAWGFYGHRLKLYRRTVPHAGFALLRRWGARMPKGVRIYTSNVDGQFQKAGFDESQVHECHGSIHHLQCTEGCNAGIWSAANFEPVVDDAACRLLSPLPRCPHCDALARPNILMFGDGAWRPERTEAQQRGEAAWLQRLARERARVVLVELGAGTAVPSVRHFGQYVGHAVNARLVRINPRESAVSHPHDVAIASGALAALQAIDDLLS